MNKSLSDFEKRVNKVLGTKTLGNIEGITVEKTTANDILMLQPTVPNPVFIVSYINEIGDEITIPISTTSLHISVRQGEYKPFPTENAIQVEAFQD